MNNLSFDILWLRINNLIYRKKDRFAYFLSLLIVMTGFFYVDWFCNDNRCLVCHPLMSIPWRGLFLNFFTAVGGIYTCTLICIALFIDDHLGLGFVIAVACSLFWTIQSIRRCHDRNESGWRILIPFYPLFLLFLPGKNKGKGSSLESIIITIWNSKWLILTFLLLCAFVYLQNAWYIQRHMEL